jgi:hypothetical protein
MLKNSKSLLLKAKARRCKNGYIIDITQSFVVDNFKEAKYTFKKNKIQYEEVINDDGEVTMLIGNKFNY